jgi:hypothetical protein
VIRADGEAGRRAAEPVDRVADTLPLDQWPEAPPDEAWVPPHGCGDGPSRDAAPLPDEALAGLAMDVFPGVGARAPGWLLGPWSEVLSAGDPWQRRAWVAAVGAAAFTMSDDLMRSPARSWQRDSPRPDVALRRRLVVVQRAPWVVYGLEAAGPRFRLRPLIEAAAWWAPDEPVSLAGVGSVDGGPVDGGALICRGVPGPDGWTPCLGLTVRARPPEALLTGTWRALVAAMRADNPAVRREDVLRLAGHQLVRVVHNHAWRAL